MENVTSTSSAHTPAPWELIVSKGNKGILERGRCTIAYLDFVSAVTNQPLLNIEANAQLIAAAPDLLEACKAMERCQGNLPKELWTKYCKPAIAKAEGRA